ncbi:GP46-like surface antigen, putative, partial [Bodo saltans]
SVFGDESSTTTTRITGSLPVEYRQWREIVSFDTRLQRIDGTLPPQYSDWNRTIEVFLVGYNSLSGTLPESYASWSRMSNFVVGTNSLSGTLPASYGAGWGTSLLVVQFSQNSFHGSLPAEAYAHWTNITLFGASINNLTGTIPDAYGSAWNRTINEFYCADNQLNGTLPDSFWLWSRISVFAVGTNNLTGTLPESYGPGWGDSISYFEAPKNGLNGTIPRAYGTYWRNMSHIALTQNKLSGTLPATLARWTKLSFLYLRDNLLEGTLPIEFGAAWSTSISQVNLASNLFEGSLPQEYSAWTSLTSLDCGNNRLNGSLSSSFGPAWGPTITSFTATNNRFIGSIPSSFSAWTSIGRFAADGNALNGTIPVYIPTAWSQLTLLYLRSNRLSGTIHNNFDQLKQLNQLYLNCNDLDGTVPSTFRTMTALQYLTVSGNPKLSGPLPAAWGTSGASLSLRLLNLQNTSLFGTLPSSWSTSSSSLFSLGSFLTVCHTQLCGGAPPGGISVFVLQLCLQDDDSLCAMPDVAALASKAASFPVSSLPPCSSSTVAPPTTAPPSNRWQNATTIKFTSAQTAVAIIGGPVAAVAALAASTSAGLGTVRAGAAMRLVACGGATNDDTHDDEDVNELALLGGGYLAGYLGVCILLGVLVAWRVYTKKDVVSSGSSSSSSSSLWSATTTHLRLPGRAWGIVSGVVPSLVEYGLGLLVAAHSDPGLVVLGTVSLACSLLTCAWVWTIVTCRFDNVEWKRTDLRRRTTTTTTTPRRASSSATHISNQLLHSNKKKVLSVLVHRLHARMEEYTRQRSHGTWMDAHHHRGKKRNNEEESRSSPLSFVATHGAVFEDYCEGRVWFVVWESALAVAVSVLSAVAGAVTEACNALQIVGAVLQMAGLVMLVVARPHREARALCVGVAMEVLGFVGGVCLLVSAAAFPDDDSNSWSTAASDVLQAQFYVGAALVVIDGLYSRRIINALRSFFNAEQNKRQQPELSLPTHSWVHGGELRHRQLRDLIATICTQQRKQKRQGNIYQEQQY